MQAAITQTRRTVTRSLAGLELPDAFRSATQAAALNAFSRTTKSAKASRRRLLEKTLQLDEVGR